MKKISIITFHSAYNYGAILQTLALYHTLKYKINAKPVVVDYTAWSIKLADFLRLFPITLNINEIICGFFSLKNRIQKRISFRSFLNSYLTQTARYSSFRKLRANPPDVDIAICGSDQIWNPSLVLDINPAYYLDYCKKYTKRVSYAASFGVSDLSQNTKERIKKYLEEMDCISVREKSGIDIVSSVVRSKPVSVHLDPTLLLTADEWTPYLNPTAIPGKRYILIYKMQNNEKVYQTAQTIKAATGLEIIEISNYGYRRPMVDKVMTNIGPQDFLALIFNAEYVCTNSYHGLLFSITAGKQCFLHQGNRWNERCQHILEMMFQQDRYIYDQELTVDNYMDYCIQISEDNVTMLSQQRKLSIAYLSELCD